MNIRGIFSVTISIMLVIAMCTLSGYAQIAQNDLSNEQSQISDLPIDLLLNEMVEIYENEDDI